jgi:hypothetical protein
VFFPTPLIFRYHLPLKFAVLLLSSGGQAAIASAAGSDHVNLVIDGHTRQHRPRKSVIMINIKK